jgi:hypothetical protein
MTIYLDFRETCLSFRPSFRPVLNGGSVEVYVVSLS